ncbi:regulator of nonsense transcripts 1 homolog [Daktulosphaira vitifoliae]|uniref:regulator of nonsense transcripts 1 homolog n=1 Tax=Daktulosphaira vitifoliae TaxID=58002 RepID=UPI0021A9D868|nr:regulator of nonsense transcripts 1 homolog [Daktulosphaira vitifoliae]XP_050529979.1 regulator of nonsense transcripts 1 homolog [Daktulosphaira vitifoliae]
MAMYCAVVITLLKIIDYCTLFEKTETKVIQINELNAEDDKLPSPCSPHSTVPPTNIPCVFSSSKKYGHFFQPLISAECSYNLKLGEKHSFECKIVSSQNYNKKSKVRFQMSSKNNVFVVDEELWISSPKMTNAIKGIVTNFDQFMSVVDVEVNFSIDLPIGTPATLKKSFDKTPYTRMEAALATFSYKYESVSPEVRSMLLGRQQQHSPERDENLTDNSLLAPNLPGLNESQLSAVSHALRTPVSLIQGPPGTGKTVTCANIVYNLSKSGTVLVCAPSNNAVDNLANAVAKTGIDVVRLVKKTKETVKSDLSNIYLSEQIKKLAGHSEFKTLQGQIDQGVELSPNERRDYNYLRRMAEIDCLANCRVVCTTCSGAGDNRLEKINFSSVVVDECAQGLEPECIIPITHGAKKVVLIGDHCQLGPVVTCPDTRNGGLHRSLFERLVAAGLQPFRLTVQYRMHPEISEYASQTMYESTIRNGVTCSDRTGSIDFTWPNPNVPMVFYSSDANERKSRSGTSFLNYGEAKVVEQLVAKLLSKGATPNQIGVITPYEGQRSLLKQILNKNKGVEVSSVDAFQGREKEYIIISCVRSNERNVVGFLNCVRRLNVALTRAKFGLFLVGNANFLVKNPTWKSLLRYYDDRNLIVEGTVDDMRTAHIKFD